MPTLQHAVRRLRPISLSLLQRVAEFSPVHTIHHDNWQSVSFVKILKTGNNVKDSRTPLLWASDLFSLFCTSLYIRILLLNRTPSPLSGHHGQLNPGQGENPDLQLPSDSSDSALRPASGGVLGHLVELVRAFFPGETEDGSGAREMRPRHFQVARMKCLFRCS